MERKNCLKIGMVCYPTYGGSGVVATELGRYLARRGHTVHFISYSMPFRLAVASEENVHYHKVNLIDYPVFPSPSYTLSLAVKIMELTVQAELDVIHVHYAVPHAVSAYLARQMLAPRRIALVTTLHGTDITLVGSHPALHPAVRFAIEQSDAVTAVSQWLADQTVGQFQTTRPIAVTPNFVDPEIYRCRHGECPMRRFVGEGEKVVLHISNFRPVKRVGDVVRAFAKIREKVKARLLLVGDGPEREAAEDLARELGVLGATAFLGRHTSTECFYSIADVFLLTSKNEAFGLAALEAMSAQVPVVAYAGGGIVEVVTDGATGCLVSFGDVEALAARAVELLQDGERARAMGRSGRQKVLDQFAPDRIAAQYEAVYQTAIATALR
ncbi:MAG: N-acetyl-alpha-D-glucosaminyl L-malate synthase BshA [Candidatus Sumerlaeia bacterium]|nr:N-acetyl-alpha-D-glucosaminyl L-malate synthase BshA [Candidatus Sumerlaeia bacterium]